MCLTLFHLMAILCPRFGVTLCSITQNNPYQCSQVWWAFVTKAHLGPPWRPSAPLSAQYWISNEAGSTVLCVFVDTAIFVVFMKSQLPSLEDWPRGQLFFNLLDELIMLESYGSIVLAHSEWPGVDCRVEVQLISLFADWACSRHTEHTWEYSVPSTTAVSP